MEKLLKIFFVVVLLTSFSFICMVNKKNIVNALGLSEKKDNRKKIADMAALSDVVYSFDNESFKLPQGYKMEKSITGDNGFQAAAFRNTTTGQIIISYRGTDDLKDVVSDIQLGLDIKNSYYDSQIKQSFDFYNSVTQEFGKDKVSLTGHSLGGNLAQIVGAKNQVETNTFNAPGVTESSIEKWVGTIRQSLPIINHIKAGDVIGNYGNHIGETIVYPDDKVIWPARTDIGRDVRELRAPIDNTISSTKDAVDTHSIKPFNERLSNDPSFEGKNMTDQELQAARANNAVPDTEYVDQLLNGVENSKKSGNKNICTDSEINEYIGKLNDSVGKDNLSDDAEMNNYVKNLQNDYGKESTDNEMSAYANNLSSELNNNNEKNSMHKDYLASMEGIRSEHMRDNSFQSSMNSIGNSYKEELDLAAKKEAEAERYRELERIAVQREAENQRRMALQQKEEDEYEDDYDYDDDYEYKSNKKSDVSLGNLLGQIGTAFLGGYNQAKEENQTRKNAYKDAQYRAAQAAAEKKNRKRNDRIAKQNAAYDKMLADYDESMRQKALLEQRNKETASSLRTKIGELRREYNKLLAERDRVLKELAEGLYCSECMRTASEIESGGEDFNAHLKRVKGAPVPAPREIIMQKLQQYNQRLSQIQSQINALERQIPSGF